MYRLHRPSKTFVRKHYRAISVAALTLTFTAAALFSHASYASTSNTRLDAWGTLEVAGSDVSNMSGTGVDVYSNGSSAFYTPNKPNNCVTVGTNCVTSGEKWQCVEFVNRLYLTKGWITATWTGNGGDLYANRSNVGLTGEANGSVTNLQPGDEISFHVTTIAEGHTAVVSSVSGTSASIINQNTGPVFVTGTLSGGTLTIPWSGYTAAGVVHHPAGGSGGGSSSAVRTITTSDGHIQVFKATSSGVTENWYSSGDGTTGTWTQPVGMPVQATGTPAVAIRSGQNVVDVFVRGTNNQVYATWYNFQSGSWGGWVGVGGGPFGFTSDPQAIATSDGHYQLLGTGGGVVEQLWYNPNGTYGTWTTSPGLAVSAGGTPGVVLRSGQNVLDAFVRGGNNQVYETWYDFRGGGWGGWIGMGGGPLSATGDPRAVLTSDNHDQVFVTGGGYTQQNWFDTIYGHIGGWTSSSALGATGIGAPAIQQRAGQNVIDVFVHAANNQVYETWYDFQGGGWGGWIGMGGGPDSFMSDPQVVATPVDNHDQVFGIGGGLVQQNWFDIVYGHIGGWRAF